jgi:hypothetical protein
VSDDDQGVEIEIHVHIYGGSKAMSDTVAEIALDAAAIMQKTHQICGADVVIGLLTAAMTLLERHDAGALH